MNRGLSLLGVFCLDPRSVPRQQGLGEIGRLVDRVADFANHQLPHPLVDTHCVISRIKALRDASSARRRATSSRSRAFSPSDSAS